jgi:Zn-dependent protease
MGDPTAYRLGRCSLNPLRHLEPLGTNCLLFAPIGWAKPVPVNPLNFHDPRKGDLVTSIAGPASNLAQAVIFGLLLRLTNTYASHFIGTEQEIMLDVVWEFLATGILVNMGLAIFNMIPLFPLDGFHVILQLTRPERQQQLLETQRFGPFVILGIVLLGHFGNVDILGRIIWPPTHFIFSFVAGLDFDI